MADMISQHEVQVLRAVPQEPKRWMTNHEMVVACKASKNGTFLRISGEWVPIFVPEMAA